MSMYLLVYYVANIWISCNVESVKCDFKWYLNINLLVSVLACSDHCMNWNLESYISACKLYFELVFVFDHPSNFIAFLISCPTQSHQGPLDPRGSSRLHCWVQNFFPEKERKWQTLVIDKSGRGCSMAKIVGRLWYNSC